MTIVLSDSLEPKTAFSYGNRCGHDPLAPVLTPINHPTAQNLPKILSDAIDSVSRFYKTPERLDALRVGRRAPRQKHHKYTRLEEVTSRSIRSERREALCRVLHLILAHTNLTSCRLGIPLHQEKKFLIFDLHWLADKTGLGYARICRAIADITHAGFIHTVQRKEVKEGKDGTVSFRARTAVRVVQKKLFLALGISEQRYIRERRAAYERQQKKIDALAAGGDKYGYKEMRGTTGRQSDRPILSYPSIRVDGHNQREEMLRRRFRIVTEHPELDELSFEQREIIINKLLIEELTN